MEIILGRESGVQQPRLQINCEGKNYFLGTPGSVGKKVSRQHCRLDVKPDGAIVSITDITENNFMYINGKEFKSKKGISLTDVIELGPEKYKLDITAILKLVIGTPTYHIAPLREVYDSYQKELMDMQVKIGIIGAMSSFPTILSLSAGILVSVIPGINPSIRCILIIIAASLAILFFYLRLKTASSNPRKRKNLDDDFHNRYVCPNPNCRHFFGTMRPDELLTNKACPWCKSKLVE